MSYPSPRTPGSPAIHDYDSVYTRMSSATPTPSPRPTWTETTTPRRPATRAAHGRFNSYSQSGDFSPRPPKDSPRYNSNGQYSTADVSPKHSSSQRPSGSSPRSSKRDRRCSFTYVRASTPYGESDEDEIIEALGHTYVLPAQSRSKHHHQRRSSLYSRDLDGGWYTNADDYVQGAQTAAFYDEFYGREQPQQQQPVYQQPPHPRPPTSFSHNRRTSTAVPPQRPQTVRPPSSSRAKPQPPPPQQQPPPATPKATDLDARKHRIPTGYSLKNWDPTEEPILLLGSVFDANSLGKWIYDWTVYHQGPATPISDMAGELWLLLIQLAGKVKRAEEIVGQVRSTENRDLVEEFIEGGERLTEKLRTLLKACEAPMLKAAKRKQGLGKNAGVEFVETLFGRDRELAKTEKFMQNVRLFNLRFDANCEEILRNPTK